MIRMRLNTEHRDALIITVNGDSKSLLSTDRSTNADPGESEHVWL